MKRRLFIAIAAILFPVIAWANTRGSIRGRAADPAGGVIPGVIIQLTNTVDGAQKATVSNEEGYYEFEFVEVGRYRWTAQAAGFRSVEQNVTVTSGQRLEVNLRFSEAAGPTTEVTVTEIANALDARTTSVQTGFTKSNVEHLAGASESISALEAYTGTAWRSQEHLHIRGAHQIAYQVNGIAIPDLSLFGPITPFIDPRNLKFAEITTGGLLPEFGDRTAGIVNAITRSGFDVGERGRFEASGGNLGRGSLFANFGGHLGDKFAYYLQGTGLVSDRGFNPPPDRLTPANILDRPKRQDVHNYRRTLQNFGNFEWRPNMRDSVNLVLGGYRSDFQIPNTIEQQEAERDYVQFERDHFQNLRWTRSLSADRLLTVSAYHHFNKLEVNGRSDKHGIPLANDNRRANYFGGQLDFAQHAGRHLIKVGAGSYTTRLKDDFSVLPELNTSVPARSWEHSLYVQDQFDATDHLTLNYGARLDLFSVNYGLNRRSDISRRDNFLSPRVGFAYKLGDHKTVIFGNASYLFLPPPIEFFESPSFTPVRPEKDIQYDIGVRFPVKDFRFRVNQWFKRQNRFLDHIQYGDANIFLPVNLDRARTHGVEAFVESPSYRGLRAYANYSLNYAQAIGGIVHGFNDGAAPESKYFFLDHDQRHRLYFGADYNIERWQAFVNVSNAFGSGFPDASDGLFGQCVTHNCRLPSHSTVNLTIGKSLTRNVDARFEIENITNRVYPINLGSEFNGSHVSPPRLMTVRLAYHF